MKRGGEVYQDRLPLTPHQAAGQPFKFTIPESLDRIKEEFQFLQAQYHSLKLECEKLASEKTEMQRHYYYEMSYGLNIEMHKQTEIAKRLNTICAQVIPFLSQEHQQQVAQAVERAKQVTMAELNAIIGSHLAIKDDKKHHDPDHHRAAGLRTPLAVPGPYPAPFGMVPHAGMNGELTSPGAAYASLHNMSPQMSAAAAAAAVVAYGRSPMSVLFSCHCRWPDATCSLSP
ncbi:Transducin-like enhancer protein 1 [Varanus komodoensis]|nr:Transducin-like enhancer protein 1 [Varanus komodoensis]